MLTMFHSVLKFVIKIIGIQLKIEMIQELILHFCFIFRFYLRYQSVGMKG